MNILDEIIARKHVEVAERKQLYPTKKLEQTVYFQNPVYSLKEFVQRKDKSGIIAEIKRKSPSKGDINTTVSIERTSKGYVQAGATALSVLTDYKFFGGSNYDLTVARSFNACPILRKDFVIDEYQVIEAKSIGADAILLIAACLEPKKLSSLAVFARSLKLEILMEVHNQAEVLDNLNAPIDLIGVNNRNLKTFVTDIEISKRLSDHIPSHLTKVSESGIEKTGTIIELKKHGYQGFLMGQNFMQHSSPETACKEFIDELNLAEGK